MSGPKNSKAGSFFIGFVLFLITITILGAIVLLIMQKNSSISDSPKESHPTSLIINEEPVVLVPETIYSNEAATYISADKVIKTMLCYNADGSLRNEYHYDEFGRLLYFYSHSSTSETEIITTDEYEILSTYTNSKHFGDEYYDKNHHLVRFVNLKNGYEYNYLYDDNGNVLSEDYLTSTGATRYTEYTYDSENRLSSATCTLNEVLNSVTVNTYAGGKLVLEKSAVLLVDSQWMHYETYFTYDADGRILSSKKYRTDEESPNSLIQWFEYVYDKFGRIISLQKTCDSADRIYTEEYSFNENGLSSKCVFSYKNPAGEIDRLSDSGYIIYSYDTTGNVTLRETHYDRGEITKEVFDYTYDSEHCIIKQINYFNDTISSTYEYTYFE